MPELPEVEIVKQSLKKKIKFKEIKKVTIRNRNLRFKLQKNFGKFLKNRFVKEISRISKYLILELDNQKYCIIHLGMSGTIHLINKKKQNKFTNLSFYQSRKLSEKHNHVELLFSNFKIIYNDPRRFGYFKIINTQSELKEFFNRIGPEAISENFNLDYLKKKLINKTKNIKNLLLDQNFVSGIGNIYANEILFYSKIHPKKKAFQINTNEMNKLVKFSKHVLQQAIRYGGSTIRDFMNAKGSIGRFQKEFKVYDREHKKCLRENCNGKIIKNFITNRSTFFCNFCQK
jgi:formamidopyrimidine-DNA glycosylase